MISLDYLRQWQAKYYSNDIIIGVLLALALLPGAIAFSFIAGVSPSMGLLSTSMIMLVISITGSRTIMVTAPSSGVSLVAAPIVAHHGVKYLILATLAMGIIQIIFGLCHLNKVLDLIPNTVVIGFMNALGILLFTSQLSNIFHISSMTYVVVIISLIIIWLVPKFTRIIPSSLVAIIVLTLCAWYFKPNIKYVADLSTVHIMLPKLYLPLDILTLHSVGVILFYGLMMAIVATVQTTLTARLIDELTHSTSNKNKESIGQGIATIITSSLSGIGGSALVGQSRFIVSMGVTSRITTCVAGVFLFISLFAFSNIIGKIPMAVLATVLITISLTTFDRRTKSYIEAAPFKNGTVIIVTMIIILASNNLAYGVLFGTIFYYTLNNIFKNKRSDT
ncbi:SulP family inorganic anion transporter [Staphylococcus kloosii]|uniref:SulP family inorganic anion transporter n=1 Tax=Staphylococcus kloosii TaxID=29384 RepID=UPI0028A46B2D|nr:SulP family inorganic anion transporter [Staphylococcus kloosii]MDT3958679.1 SulP family inorganic anion transporter [Staphylococcus kloosii]